MGHYINKYPESKAKDGKAPMKVRKIEDFGFKPDPEAKSVSRIRIRYLKTTIRIMRDIWQEFL